MRQFYETYMADEKVSPLVRQLSWTHNLIIFTQSKRPEEREFYLRTAVDPGARLQRPRHDWIKKAVNHEILGQACYDQT